MPKEIEVVVRSTPENPECGYGDQVTVTEEGKDIYGGHCSSCPNPYSPSTKEPWKNAYAWIAPGEYGWAYAFNPKFGRCLLINQGGPVPTRNPNANQKGKQFATGIYIHAGGIASKNPLWRGSRGCITIHPVEYENFISKFKAGDHGKIKVVDFFENKIGADTPTPDTYTPIKLEVAMPDEKKKWYASKTVWLNVVSGALELVQIVGGLQIAPAGTITLVTNVLNIALRFITKAPIGA